MKRNNLCREHLPTNTTPSCNTGSDLRLNNIAAPNDRTVVLLQQTALRKKHHRQQPNNHRDNPNNETTTRQENHP
ncbi:hypothetical protein D6783_04660 [Candidatus Woesearchaeota archaeon]|nr:MAG: hypothetical protein D6783_04660 [Candidatus Woesearchaeota archaeon]